MNVIAKISCYLERGVVTLKLRKEYLNSVTHTISVLLRIKYWTVWCIERYSMSTYTGVTNCQKTVRFFGPPCIWHKTVISSKCALQHKDNALRRYTWRRLTSRDFSSSMQRFILSRRRLSTSGLFTCHRITTNRHSDYVICTLLEDNGVTVNRNQQLKGLEWTTYTNTRYLYS